MSMTKSLRGMKVTSRCLEHPRTWNEPSRPNDFSTRRFKAKGSWCNTASGLCLSFFLSFFCFETIFLLDGRWGWAFWKAVASFLCWCKHWRKILSPALWSDILCKDTSFSVSSVHLKCNEERLSASDFNLILFHRNNIQSHYIQQRQLNG